jgi:DNA processing protein
MSTNDLKYQIAISLIPGIGNVLAKKLISYTGSIEAVFREKKRNLIKIPGIGDYLAESIIRQDVLSIAESEIDYIEKNHIRTFFYLEENYPVRLKQCEDAPVIFFLKGEANLDSPKILSIVGTRNATYYGRECCEEIIHDLAASHPELIIVSGLAYGIDIMSHRSALKNKLKTIAVLAHGLKYLYPPAHLNTAREIVSQGGLLTDFISSNKPEPNNFIKRNRIIAGLAEGTLVVESDIEGGALITADIANSYNREVIAIPGRRDDKFSSGCNALIKSNKAAMAECAHDIELILGWDSPKSDRAVQTELFTLLSPEEELLFDIIRNSGKISVDDLSLKSGFPTQKTSALLLNLEFANHIRSLPGKIYTI